MQSAMRMETHGASRVFRFVDQTDRSQKAVNKHKTIVRSHVMTEIRRQKRSKSRLEPESGPFFHDPHEGTDDLPPDRYHYTQPQPPSWQFDETTEADSGLAEEPLPWRHDGPERWQARVTSHSPCNIQQAVDLQATKRSDSWTNSQTYETLQVRTANHSSDDESLDDTRMTRASTTAQMTRALTTAQKGTAMIVVKEKTIPKTAARMMTTTTTRMVMRACQQYIIP